MQCLSMAAGEGEGSAVQSEENLKGPAGGKQTDVSNPGSTSGLSVKIQCPGRDSTSSMNAIRAAGER